MKEYKIKKSAEGKIADFGPWHGMPAWKNKEDLIIGIRYNRSQIEQLEREVRLFQQALKDLEKGEGEDTTDKEDD